MALFIKGLIKISYLKVRKENGGYGSECVTHYLVPTVKQKKQTAIFESVIRSL